MLPKILINASHTSTGGGFVYLQGILPYLAQDSRFSWTLMAPENTLKKLDIPDNISVTPSPDLSFWKGHWWEQTVLPRFARKQGFSAVLCNANYTPLFAPKPVPILHTTPRAAAEAATWRMRFYWIALKVLTYISLLRAPIALSVARHVIADYASARTARKVHLASPAVGELPPAAAHHDANLIVSIGDFYPQKDYPTLIRAFHTLLEKRPASRLLIIGKMVDPLVTQQVKALIAELELSRSVTLAGAVPHARLLQVLQQAGLYVSTSKAECFNMPVLEAMTCGVPCVLADMPFQREVADNAAIYVPISRGGDIPAAFAVAMFGVLETSISETLIQLGKNRAAQFGWSKTATVIGNALARVLKIG